MDVPNGHVPCTYVRRNNVETAFPAVSLFYGTESPLPLVLRGRVLTRRPIDLLVFAIIIYTSLKSTKGKIRIPGLFKVLVEDATRYFLVVFISHLSLELTLVFANVRIVSYFRAVVC